jgi:hypothetical protein
MQRRHIIILSIHLEMCHNIVAYICRCS